MFLRETADPQETRCSVGGEAEEIALNFNIYQRSTTRTCVVELSQWSLLDTRDEAVCVDTHIKSEIRIPASEIRNLMPTSKRGGKKKPTIKKTGNRPGREILPPPSPVDYSTNKLVTGTHTPPTANILLPHAHKSDDAPSRTTLAAPRTPPLPRALRSLERKADGRASGAGHFSFGWLFSSQLRVEPWEPGQCDPQKGRHRQRPEDVGHRQG